jgi:hypothetical protein
VGLVELGRYPNSANAYIVRGRLAADGIEAVCFDTGMNFAEGAAVVSGTGDGARGRFRRGAQVDRAAGLDARGDRSISKRRMAEAQAARLPTGRGYTGVMAGLAAVLSCGLNPSSSFYEKRPAVLCYKDSPPVSRGSGISG